MTFSPRLHDEESLQYLGFVNSFIYSPFEDVREGEKDKVTEKERWNEREEKNRAGNTKRDA